MTKQVGSRPGSTSELENIMRLKRENPLTYR